MHTAMLTGVGIAVVALLISLFVRRPAEVVHEVAEADEPAAADAAPTAARATESV